MLLRLQALLVLLATALLILPPRAASARDRGDDEEAEDSERRDEEERKEESHEEDEGSSKPKSDHDATAKSFGLGLLGVRVVPAAAGSANTIVITPDGDAVLTIEPDEVVVPVFGGRYWISSVVGIELGLGFNVKSGSVERQIPNPDPSLEKTAEVLEPATTAVVGHLALPLSVFSRRHYGLLLIGELDIGYSTSTVEDFELSVAGEALDLTLSGLLIGAGARLGFELSFGFFDVPQLSLQTSFGLRFESTRRKGKIGDAEATISGTSFGTSTYDDPWATLAGGLGIYYHF